MSPASGMLKAVLSEHTMGGPTPEPDVSDLDRSLAFYVGAVGFAVTFDRPEEYFAFLTLKSVRLMLEEAAGPGRRFRTAPLEHPYGRGVNFMIEVAEIDQLYSRVQAAGYTIVVPPEERWYRQNEVVRVVDRARLKIVGGNHPGHAPAREA